MSIFIRFCPDCQHATLVERLQENLTSFELLLKKRDADNKRKERLAFVSLSLSNMIPKTAKSSGKNNKSDEEGDDKQEKRTKKRRPQNSGSSSGDSSDSSSGSSSGETLV
jgi:remodeling and spacing factor 1